MYRTISHTTTDQSPAQILFQHTPDNSLPTIEPNKTESNPQQTANREQNKAYIDIKRSTKHKEFQ